MQQFFFLLVMSLFMNTCSTTKEMPSTKEVSKIEIESPRVNNNHSKTDLISQKWLLIKTKDPYNKGAFSMQEKENPKTLEFSKDGTYIEKDPWQENKGSWFFNEDETKMSMNLSERGEANYRWSIIKLTQEEMILGIQGRHGTVEHYYLPSK